VGGVLVDCSPGYLYRDLIFDKDELDRFMNDVFHRNAILVLDGYSSIYDGFTAMAKKPPEHSDLILAYTEHWVKTIGGEIECSVAVLKDVKATRLNEIGAMEITDIPTARGFVSLAAVIDWFTRQVQSGRLSITLEAIFSLNPLKKRLPDMANRIFLTPVRAHSLLLLPSPRC
jgi:hypothetical protein